MNPSRIERKNSLMDGLMRVNPVIRLKEDVEVCGPYTKFDLIEKGWNPELWGYFLPKDFRNMWVFISDTEAILMDDIGVQVLKELEEEEN